MGQGVVELGVDPSGVSRGMGSVSRILKIGLGYLGARHIIGFFKESVRLAGVQEDAEAKLQAAIRRRGAGFGASLGQMKRFASGLRDVTRYSSTEVLSAAAMATTFQSISGKEMPRVIAVAADMAAAMGTDLDGAVSMVSKSLEMSGETLVFLSRQGTHFTEAEKEQVKALMAAGKVAEAHSIILSKLEARFKGAAAAMGDTFAGKVGRLEGKIKGLKKEIGAALIPVLEDMIGQADKGADSFKGIGDALSKCILDFKLFGLGVASALAGASAEIVDFVAFVWTNFKKLPEIATWVAEEWKNIFQDAATVGADWMATLLHKWADITPGSLDELDKATVERMTRGWDRIAEWMHDPKPELTSLGQGIHDATADAAAKGFAEGFEEGSVTAFDDLKNKPFKTNLPPDLFVPPENTALGDALREYQAGLDATIKELFEKWGLEHGPRPTEGFTPGGPDDAAEKTEKATASFVDAVAFWKGLQTKGYQDPMQRQQLAAQQATAVAQGKSYDVLRSIYAKLSTTIQPRYA